MLTYSLPPSFTKLVDQFRKLPGIGGKSAQKLAFHILSLSKEQVGEFASSLTEARSRIIYCERCKNLSEDKICNICNNKERDGATICVVEDTRYLIAIERTREYNGLYHVLHGLISPMDDIGPDDIYINELVERVKNGGIEEVIIATNPNVEGEVTATYISRLLKPLRVKTTRLAYGVPVGADLEYADEVTLFRAIEGRKEL